MTSPSPGLIGQLETHLTHDFPYALQYALHTFGHRWVTHILRAAELRWWNFVVMGTHYFSSLDTR